MLLRAGEQISLTGQADDGPSGLIMIADQQPQLVLIDANLPDEQAWEVVEYLIKEHPNIYSLILAHTPQQHNRAMAAGADATLPDGFTTETLFTTLRTLINEPKN